VARRRLGGEPEGAEHPPHGVGLRHRPQDPARVRTAIAHQHGKPEHPAEQPGPGPASRGARPRGRARVVRRWPRDEGRAPAGERAEEPMVGEQGPAARRDEGGQALPQLQRIEEERGGPVAPARSGKPATPSGKLRSTSTHRKRRHPQRGCWATSGSPARRSAAVRRARMAASVSARPTRMSAA